VSRAPLIPEQRQQELLRLLRSAGVLSIRDLTDRLDVSHMTVRRDIAALERSGHVVSVQGGVRLADWTGHPPPRERASRAALELPRKQAIAETASLLIEDGTVIFLDAGTTCQSVVPFLAARSDLTVVTNDFHTVVALLEFPTIQVIHTGGEVDVSSASSSGPLAVRIIEELNLDRCFLSTGAWDLPHGITSPSTDKVLLKRAAMESASTVALLADSTKWGSFERFTVTGLDRLDIIVTDDQLPRAVVDRIAEQGPTIRQAAVGEQMWTAER
jgi:DeoR/GlpR family transcriptional regulator of sugar metabolism